VTDDAKAGGSPMSDMLRRAFITLLGGAAAAWPLAARAQKGDGVRRVAVIMGFAENDEVWQAYLASFRQGLQELAGMDRSSLGSPRRSCLAS
jgi:putative ABC transport system substrate-binding protein